jgi:hypothetical protein
MEKSLQSRHQGDVIRVMTTIDGVVKRFALPPVAGLDINGRRGAIGVGAAGRVFWHIARDL